MAEHNKKKVYLKLDLVELYNELDTKLGKQPTKIEWRRADGYPAESTVVERFGSWSEFITECGGTPKNAWIKKKTTPVRDKKKFRLSVYLSAETLAMIGNRKPSQVINQILCRVAAAGESMDVSTEEHDHIKSHPTIGTRKVNSPYPDQGEILKQCADYTGRSIPECVVVLDKVERES